MGYISQFAKPKEFYRFTSGALSCKLQRMALAKQEENMLEYLENYRTKPPEGEDRVVTRAAPEAQGAGTKAALSWPPKDIQVLMPGTVEFVR